ncbi:MAG: DegT/DnrJ/EryC1/StrS family aminotransferase [Thermotogae bacterium]|nr:DegT/DnrJ/EryC1/StrS family aminotransferase [Thermotogota bacterium]
MTLGFRIPLSRPDIDGNDVKAVESVLRSSMLSIGPKVEEFEKRVAEYVGAECAVAVNSGTSALHLLVKIAGLGPGDFLATSPFTFIASANVALFERAFPIFVDIEEKTLNVDVEALEDLLIRAKKGKLNICGHNVDVDRLKVFMGVDIFGQPMDWDPALKLCEEYDVTAIDDSCEALGAEYKGCRVGTFGMGGAFAFYPNKQITTGEGGIIVSSDLEVCKLAKSMRNQGRGEGDGWLYHVRLGYNYRMDEMSAALGVSQLERLDTILDRRAEVARRYNALFENTPVEPHHIAPYTTRMSWFVYVVRLPEGINRDRIVDYMAKKGIQTRNYFTCVHLQPFYRQLGYSEGMYPTAEKSSKRTLALPFYNRITQKEQEEVVSTLLEALERVG